MSKSNQKQDIFSQIVLVNIDNAIWSGYKRTTDGDLLKMKANLPGGGIITKGGKKIYPTESFTPFNTLKKEISRKLMSVGVSALGGSARVIPNSQVDEIQDFIAESKTKFSNLLDDFVNDYDAKLESHLNSITDPVVREIVERSTLDKIEAARRFRFTSDVFKIVPSKGDGEGLVSNLANKLFHEVSTAAREAYEKSFQGKPRVGQRALNQIVMLRNKMAGLEMLDGENIQPLVNSIDNVLEKMPADGWIEGVNFSALIGLVLMLCEPEDMLEHAQKIQKGYDSTVTQTQPVVDDLLADAIISDDDTPVDIQTPEIVEMAPEQEVIEAVPVMEVVAVAETTKTVKKVKQPKVVQPQLSLVEDIVDAGNDDDESNDKPLPLVTEVTKTQPPAQVKQVAAFF